MIKGALIDFYGGPRDGMLYFSEHTPDIFEVYDEFNTHLYILVKLATHRSRYYYNGTVQE